MAVRLTDIAERLGLSESTVSLALNNKEVVKAATRKRVQEAARQMGYTPNVMAKTLARQKSSTVGIIVTDIANAYFGEFAKICEICLREQNYSPVIASTRDRYALEARVIDQFIAQRVAGVIIVPPAKDNVEVQYLSRLEEYGIKYLYATSYYSQADAPSVMVDLEKGTHQAVGYLLDMGHRDVYFLVSDPIMIPTLKRREGYRRAFEERGLPCDGALMIHCEYPDFEGAYKATERILKSGKPVDAFVTINDIMALGCMRALLEGGRRIPEDVSLIGYDDILYSQLATIPLTTVHQDIGAIARKAVGLLTSMIDRDRQLRDKILIEPTLVVRRSTGLCRREK